MATTPQPPDPVPAGEPMSPGVRRQLQQLFDHATKTAEQAVKQGVKSNFDYANDLYAQCVLGDPGNVVYVKSLLDNLYKKFGGAKKESRFSGWLGGSSAAAACKKALGKKDWTGALKAGLSALKTNPWDADALLPMAEACEKLKLYDTQLAYLKGAFTGNAKNAGVNRICAEALTRRGRYDEAIECWRRVKMCKPDDDEPDRMIAKLAVDKTIHHGKYDEAESTTDSMKDKHAQSERRGETQQVSPETKFRQLIAQQPAEIGHYLELAEIVTREDRHAEAVEILTAALGVSGGDLKVRELLEDAQVRHGKHQLRIAERQMIDAKNDPARLEEARCLVQKLAADLNRQELEVYGSRCERYPSNLGFKYEFGLRLRRAGNYNEAIKVLQQARNDSKRKGMAHLELGECFRLIKQYPLAVTAYETALEALSGKEEDQRKLSLYWAGKVALLGTKDLDRAEKHLNALAALDYSYKDVGTLLDKLAELRQDE